MGVGGEETGCCQGDLLGGGEVDEAVVGVEGGEGEGCGERGGGFGGEDFVEVGGERGWWLGGHFWVEV